MAEPKRVTSHEFAVSKLQDSCKVICKEFGFTSVSNTAINKLGAILRSKIDEYAHMTRILMEHTGRTQATVEDVLAAFRYKRVNVADVRDFARQVRCEKLKALPLFPVPDAKLESPDEYFLAMYGPKPSDRELAERPAHIPPYFRALHPEWIEEERKAKEAAKLAGKNYPLTEEDLEEEEFNKLRKISSYRKHGNQEVKEEEAKVEVIEKQYLGHNGQRVPTLKNSLIPDFMDMDFYELGFTDDYGKGKKEEADKKAAAALAEKNEQAKAAVRSNDPVEGQEAPSTPITAASLNASFTTDVSSDSSYADQNSYIRAWCDKLPNFAAGSFTSPDKMDSSFEDSGPVFKMSDLVKPKYTPRLSGSAGGSAPTSRPGSAMGNHTPEKQRFGPGRPKKPKPEGGTPKPKGRPPKKAALEKKKQSELLLTLQSKSSTEEKSEKAEKPEKPEKKEKSKKLTIDDQIRAQMLRAKTQMLLPNSALPVSETARTPSPVEAAPTPCVTAQVVLETPKADVPPVGAIVDIESVPIVFEEPAFEVEIKTDEPVTICPISPSSEIPLENVSLEKKPKKEKRDKNSEEYKEYKRLKKERRRQEREERRQEEKREKDNINSMTVSTTEEVSATDPTQNPKLTLKIKFGANYTLPQENCSPMRPDSTNSASRPTSSRSNYQEDPPPPVNPPLKFRFKNLFNLAEQETAREEAVVSSSTPQGSRPGSSLHFETPASSSSKHHKKDRKDKEKKHKKEKERDREKEREREERKERERQKEEAARREIEEKARLEMEAKKSLEEEERRKEKERRREEKRKDKERKKEKEERRERKEKEREREREMEREREREKEREKIREKERERERKEERRKEEERKKKEKKKSTPPASPVPEAPARPLLTQDDESAASESSEEIWICPVCSVAYSKGASMVACDECEEWFHWHCVGISEEPKDTQWFCNRCSKGNKKKKQGSKRSAGGPLESSLSSKRKKH